VQIIDAHHHLWDRSRFNYGWLKQVPALDRNFPIGEYEEVIKPCGVVKSVHVQADVDEEFGLQETRWVLSMAEAGPPIAGVVAWAPVEKPGLEEFLKKLGQHDKLKGVRRLIQGEADPGFCTRPEFVAGVRQLAAVGLSFDICVYHHQLPSAIELVRQVPEVSFVLDHLGKPDIKDGRLDLWKRHIQKLASLKNVCCKISGMVTEADLERWTVEELRPYMGHAIDAFGFDRLMFGSDWPVCTLGVEYGHWLEIVQEAVKDASRAERESLFYGTAARFYRL
jgi:L-fuconolactonase